VPVQEQLAVARGARVGSRQGGVDGGRGHPGADGGAAGQLGGVQQGVQLREAGRGLATTRVRVVSEQ
jgi:hypothetical protein